MVIAEEYFNRHSLGVMAYHTQSTGCALIHRNNWRENHQSPWVCLRVSWVEGGSRPGHYTVQALVPIHDSYERREQFLHMGDFASAVQYEEFEHHITAWCGGLGGAVSPETTVEHALSCWEIFLFCFDGYIARNIPARILGDIELSVDSSVPTNDRFVAYSKAVEKLNRSFSSVMEKQENVSRTLGRNIEWLARLVNGEQQQCRH